MINFYIVIKNEVESFDINNKFLCVSGYKDASGDWYFYFTVRREASFSLSLFFFKESW